MTGSVTSSSPSQGYYTQKPRVMDDLDANEKMQMALMGAMTFDGLKKAMQKHAPRLASCHGHVMGMSWAWGTVTGTGF